MEGLAPIIICGCHGGGTSFLTKLLRHAGFYAGSEAGGITDRKYHESNAFRNANRRLLALFGDSNGMDERAARAAANYFNTTNNFSAAFRTARLADILPKFFADADEMPSTWGWKDPRNSLTFPFWHSIFPNAKSLIVVKDIDDRRAQSSSGYWFRHQATDSIRRLYMNPEWISQSPRALRIHFESIVSDFRAFDDTLRFCGLGPVGPRGHAALMRAAGLEDRSHDGPKDLLSMV